MTTGFIIGAGGDLDGYRPPLLQSFWSDHILNRVDMLRADTFSWQPGTVYSAVYEELVSEYDNVNSVEETEGGITFKRTPNGYKIADSTQETAILTKYNTDGIAWIYILDKGNIQFKLPRTSYSFVGLRDSVGGYVAESLPNITGKIHTILGGTNATSQGALSVDNNTSASLGGTSGKYKYDLMFDASRSSSTYQDNAPVQQRATQMYLYFYVGDYTQTAVEQTAGLNSELFNGKVDLNFNNMNPSQTVKSTIVEWGMPDYTAGIDVGAYNSSSNQFTAPCAGIIYFFASVPSGGRPQIYINNVMFSDLAVGGSSVSLNTGIQIVLGKGDKYYATQSTLGYTLGANKFYPLKGVN